MTGMAINDRPRSKISMVAGILFALFIAEIVAIALYAPTNVGYVFGLWLSSVICLAANFEAMKRKLRQGSAYNWSTVLFCLTVIAAIAVTAWWIVWLDTFGHYQ